MNKALTSNPFIVGRHVPEEFFCDRTDETAFLIKQIENGRNVAMISPRRMGKTGLIHHCFAQETLQQTHRTFFFDIYATTSMSEFVYMFGKTIFNTLKPRGQQLVERFFNIIGSLRMGFGIDAISGEPKFEMNIGEIGAPETTLDEIFNYLEQSEKPCVVAIDEFQQVSNYGVTNIEAMLRERIQQCQQTKFIFAGSKRHLMTNIFTSPAKPFYQSVLIMNLEPIPMSTYTDFAVQMFEHYGKTIERDVVEKVYNSFDGCTWFLQMLMNELFALTPQNGQCSADYLTTAKNNVINSQEAAYKEIFSRLPSKQKLVIIAIAKEHQAHNITSSAFVRKYGLPSASSVQAAVRPLLSNDIVTFDDGTYRIYDYFFADWISRNY